MNIRTRNQFAAILLIAGISTLSACHSGEDTSKTKNAKPNMLVAEGFVVKPQPFQNDYTASGSLLPNEEIQILPEVSGRVTGIYFQEGIHVEKGQVLVRIYNDDIKAQIQKLQAQKRLQLKIKDWQQ